MPTALRGKSGELNPARAPVINVAKSSGKNEQDGHEIGQVHGALSQKYYAERYHGTLMTTTRRNPLNSKYALITVAVWLWSR